MSNARDKQEFFITRKELRALLFWAAVGMRKSHGGSYSDVIESVIVKWADELNFQIPYHMPYPEFGADVDRKVKR